MEYIYLGKVVGTHGIKGEIKIKSSFQYKNKIFKAKTPLYFGMNKIKEVITTYRVHKNYDMVTLDNYNNINQILKYVGNDVYYNKEDLVLDKNMYLDSDLINFKVYVNGEYKGLIKEIINTGLTNKVMLLDNSLLLPYHSDLINNIDFLNKQIFYK